MITLLTGENSYEVEQELRRLTAAFEGEAETFDGATLELGQLPDLLAGLSLFAEKRLVVIRDLSASKQAWEALPELIERMSDDIHLVLIEPSVDKRTKTYKALQKKAEVKELQLLTERDSAKVEAWVLKEAKQRGAKIDKPAARELLRRSLVPAERGQPIIDQWQAVHSLEKLAVLGDITPQVVEDYIDTQPVDSVFGVFETALRGNAEALHRLLADLEPREDPYRVFGLLSSQMFQLAALAASEAPSSEVAKAVGAHPYAMSKMAPLAKKFGKGEVRQMVLAMSQADEAMKTSKGTPWTLIEQALMKIAAVAEAKTGR